MSAPDRTEFIGGSDVAAIIGVSPWKDAHTLCLEKMGELPPEDAESNILRRGKILEPAIGALYAAEHGATIEPGTTISGEAHERAQVDMWEVGEPWRIPLEIKSASEFTRGKWGASGTDDAPTYYCTQAHWQIGLAGAPFGRVVALLGADDLRVYTIQRDEQVFAFLRNAVREFWDRVQRRDPPPMDYKHPRAGDALARLFRDVDPTQIVQATDSDRAWCAVMQQAGEAMKQYEAVRDGAKAHLLYRIGSAHMLDFGDGTMFERKVIKRSGYIVEPCEYIDARVKKVPATKAGRKALAAPEESAA